MATGTETKYAMNGDLAVAYRTFGDGPRELVFVGNWFTNVETFPELPHLEEWIDRITTVGRVTFFDQPGTGSSDPVTLDALPSLEQWTDSTRVVMDALEIQRATLLAIDGAFGTAALFAATYPARTDALISMEGWARMRWAEDYPFGRTDDEIAAQSELFIALWGSGEVQHLMNPDLPWNEKMRSNWARHERLAASPAVVQHSVQLASSLDVRYVLPSIRVPTLVLQHSDDAIVPVEFGRHIANSIPNAKYVELPGHDLYLIDEIATDEIREFITGKRGGPVTDERVLATVLFTDIVESTKRAAMIGDRAWHTLLDAHDAIVRAQLTRFRGREVKTVGDGFLATFDGPQRAIRCALAIGDALRPLGIDVRAGLHTGECELRGEDIGGIAVHIGARVSALANGGEVLVSSTVRDLVVGSGLNFEDRGAHELKGLPGEWHVYVVVAS